MQKDIKLKDVDKALHQFEKAKAKRKVKRTREFEIGTSKPEDIGGNWEEVISNRKLYASIHVEFGLAEEVIGFLEFEDNTFEVGIGECLRPYDLLYSGNDRAKASKAFIEAIDRCSIL